MNQEDIKIAKRELKAYSHIDSMFGEICGTILEYIEILEERVAIASPDVVRCKDCKYSGDKKKCILAFVADKQEFPVSFYNNNGKWFCADGKAKEGKSE